MMWTEADRRLVKRFAEVINYEGREVISNTSDTALAEMLVSHLKIYEKAVSHRWHKPPFEELLGE